MADFIVDTTQRIDARNRKAEPVIAGLSGFKRTVAKASLRVANATDRFGEIMSDGPSALLAGGMYGAVRGGMLGWLLAAGISGVTGLAGLYFPILLGTAALAIINDACHNYNVMRAEDPRGIYAKRADFIASQGGALGETQAPHVNDRAQYRRATREINANKRAEKNLKRDFDTQGPGEDDFSRYPGGIVPKTESFAAKEDQRRAQKQQLQAEGVGGR